MAGAPTLQPNGEGDSLPWSHPGADEGPGTPAGGLDGGRRLPCAYPIPTLHLPWSRRTGREAETPAQRQRGRRPLPCTYPRATLERENAYPAPTLQLPRRRRRPPCRGSRVGSPSGLGRIPSRLSQFLPFLPPFHPSPPRAPRPPGLPKTPRPRATLELPLDPRPAPSRGLRTDGRPGPPDLGSWSSSYFPQK
jgi:hypothetical protein